jgi:hypothetical protein
MPVPLMCCAVVPHDHAQQYASDTLVLLTKIGITIDQVFAVLPLTVNFPAIAPGTPDTAAAPASSVGGYAAQAAYLAAGRHRP